jgi:hypothetical protein
MDQVHDQQLKLSPGASNSSLPDIVNYPTWMVRTPKGIEEIPNPLFQYVFHPIPGSASSPDEAFEIGKFTNLPGTVRAIDDEGVVQMEKANALLQEEGKYVINERLEHASIVLNLVAVSCS